MKKAVFAVIIALYMANSLLIKDKIVHVGDTICVFYKIIEREVSAGKTKKEVKEQTRERLQPYEGIVIAIRGQGDNKSFTVRRIGVDNVGVERIFPVLSPWITKITVKKKAQVRRAKLNYLRNIKGSNIIKSTKVEETVEIKTKTEKQSAKSQEQPNTS